MDSTAITPFHFLHHLLFRNLCIKDNHSSMGIQAISKPNLRPIFKNPFFHIRIACGSLGRLLLWGGPLDPKTLPLSAASAEFEQNLGLGGHHSSDPLYLYCRSGGSGTQFRLFR
jgi:hypothetical protein